MGAERSEERVCFKSSLRAGQVAERGKRGVLLFCFQKTDANSASVNSSNPKVRDQNSLYKV